MVAFTLEDVSPSVITQDVETGNARVLITRYRFFVYEFKDARTEVSLPMKMASVSKTARN